MNDSEGDEIIEEDDDGYWDNDDEDEDEYPYYRQAEERGEDEEYYDENREDFHPLPLPIEKQNPKSPPPLTPSPLKGIFLNGENPCPKKQV